MKRLLILALVVSGTWLVGATPASASCMDHVNKGGVHVYSCAAPGGPVTMYVCVDGVCVPN